MLNVQSANKLLPRPATRAPGGREEKITSDERVSLRFIDSLSVFEFMLRMLKFDLIPSI